jgi:hypothetical protein
MGFGASDLPPSSRSLDISVFTKEGCGLTDQSGRPDHAHGKFPVGIASVGLDEIERQVADDEQPPLPVNDALLVIGKPVPRQDARAKVTAAVRFTVDAKLPVMLLRAFCGRPWRMRARKGSTQSLPRACRASAPCW